ncbi:uncharacterized protein LOC123505528 isoform X2 [Portunus trituberculatus]|uniref:uncharacterized protein LOC123505528 isoform X2 n=1 Tax=Portunus trituberculatus TaxID=210409 RepID=UPI001E1CB947|nr:uncharacterized protein LOC123505528 isoform X2 [Portunus trituberculatus]
MSQSPEFNQVKAPVTWWLRDQDLWAAPGSNKCRARRKERGEPRPLVPRASQPWLSCWLVAVTCGRAAPPLPLPSVGDLSLSPAALCQAGPVGASRLTLAYRPMSVAMFLQTHLLLHVATWVAWFDVRLRWRQDLRQ